MAGLAADIPAEAMTRFTAAEARLYPLAMTDPAGYQRATTLVGLVANELRRSCADIAAVLERRVELISLLPALASAAKLSLGDLPADAVVDAASALRCRELRAAGAAEAFGARIEAAREAGVEWLVDEADPADVMSGTYRRSETHVPTGSTVITSIEAGGARAGTTYAIELISRGEAPTAPSSQRWVYPGRDAWASAVQDVRARLSGASSGGVVPRP